ncbi:MAG: serine/threonine protein kinase [Chloroflexi bacterium]|jgi:serine/threonine protein kinase|nr:serine/threonine protein kinase [Chloroflexota bacterium]
MIKINRPGRLDQPGNKQLGNYKLLFKLNDPAEPELWQAQPLKPERQKSGPVTLKPVATYPVSPVRTLNVLENFNRLMLALATLNHPTIWPLQDAGNVGSYCYLVFPHVPEAVSLDKQLQQKPLSLPRTIDLISQVLEALSFAHKQGVVHGSLTPSNILLLPNGQAKVRNFGIAKFDFDNNGVKLSQLAGASPEYMAPEQFLGYGDFTSDLYSAGILIYRLLVGELPFKGQNKLEIGQRQLNEQVPLTDEKIPVYLQFFLARALHKEPKKRFANAAQMIKTFRQVASTLPPENINQGAEPRLKTPLKPAGLFGWR